VVQHEPGAFDASMIKALAARGHQLTPLDSTYGNMQAIYWDRKAGQVHAASDPRGVGDTRVGLFR
jgi:gamma-glutamyltranspeptidase/glutathione hydrolase